MIPFSRLLTGLVFTPSRNAKLRLLTRYFDQAPDPDRGWALAAIAGELDLRSAQPSLIRGLVEERVDPVLFRLSYDYVGDLAETVSLIWPRDETQDAAPGAALRMSEVVDAIAASSRAEFPALLARLLDQLDAEERFALIKLATGGLRVGMSARLGRTALSQWGEGNGVTAPIEQLEELWHGLEPPYVPLFRWLSGAGPAPEVDLKRAFRPMMLANPLDNALYSAEELKVNAESDAETLRRLDSNLDPAEFAAEWKWDGIRVQAISIGGEKRLYSRTGDDISTAFPDLMETMSFEGVVDGELLVADPSAPPDSSGLIAIAPFADLQKRLGRKTVSAKMIRESPAHLRAYDLLHDGVDDLRPRPFRERRTALEQWASRGGAHLDVSPLVSFAAWANLAKIRAGARAASQEGLMLKRWGAPYVGGRPQGPWFKWKRDPLTADCVLMYAQRGHGKRSSYYSDYTFGAWRDGAEGPELTPVGKAYSGYTDEELLRIDRWIRNNTTDRYGPVRAVKPEVVFEIAFDAVQPSARHKSGVAMRFPRIKRIRWDKPAHEADRLEIFERLAGSR
ncbi:MAG: cisplatin damage response ATP-dependent DNA ligase [Rhodobacteraceae bacterium]|nr:cisplatin damage response ATP-dependent DNA ligase [Paracoccaceae bacterium]